MQFVELLQIALCRRAELSRTPSEQEWNELYTISKKQALLGITFAAIERLPTCQRPQRRILLQWGMAAKRIQTLNKQYTSQVKAIIRKFEEDGFRGIILKGLSVAQYYKIDHLDQLRTPGDLDIWFDSSREDTVSYARRNDPNCVVVYHHVEYPRIHGVDVEIHMTPSWMNNYFTNRVVQSYFEEQKRHQFVLADRLHELPMPTLAFNRVYILIHMYRHLFHTGIGLRQLLDCYYVLRQGFHDAERVEAMRILSSLKMERFVGAIMWVLKDVFCLEDTYLLTQPNEQEGRLLLKEMVLVGNFGHSDPRVTHLRNESDFSYGLRKLNRNFQYLRRYPSEVLWSPLFKIWHYFWRKKYN